MNSSESGFSVSKELIHWQSICEEWILLNERFSRVQGGEEKIYSYGEVSNVSVLASSAWRGGFVAMQEFSMNKANSQSGSGRGDLWVKDPGDESEEYLEAKFKWLSLHPRDAMNVASENLRKAVRDTEHSGVDEEDGSSIAVSFLGVYTSRNYDQGDEKIISALVDGFIDGKESLGYDAIAWTFPDDDVRYWKEFPEKVVDLPIGIIMMAQKVCS